jgi:hypothetical protein
MVYGHGVKTDGKPSSTDSNRMSDRESFDGQFIPVSAENTTALLNVTSGCPVLGSRAKEAFENTRIILITPKERRVGTDEGVTYPSGRTKLLRIRHKRD